jgi:hypothetical protein
MRLTRSRSGCCAGSAASTDHPNLQAANGTSYQRPGFSPYLLTRRLPAYRPFGLLNKNQTISIYYNVCSFDLTFAIKKWSAAAALVAAAFYLLLSGAEVATQRSFFMKAVVLIAVIVDRRAVTYRTLARWETEQASWCSSSASR